MSFPFLRLLYDEFDPSTYRGVQLRMGDKPEVFNTGNPTVDYLTAQLVILRRYEEAGVDPNDVPVTGSSSIDHFCMDGGELRDSEPTEEDVAEALANAKAYLEPT